MSSQARLLLRVPDRKKKKLQLLAMTFFTRRHCEALIHYHITSLVWIENNLYCQLFATLLWIGLNLSNCFPKPLFQ
jgi:hypothetical protein